MNVRFVVAQLFAACSEVAINSSRISAIETDGKDEWNKRVALLPAVLK